MISPDATPIAHVSPYKRIELGSRDKKPEPKWIPHVFNAPIEIDWLKPGYVAPSVDVFGDLYCG